MLFNCLPNLLLQLYYVVVKVLDPDGNETKSGELGNITVKLPLPPGFVDTLYLNHARFEEYFTKYPVSILQLHYD